MGSRTRHRVQMAFSSVLPMNRWVCQPPPIHPYPLWQKRGRTVQRSVLASTGTQQAQGKRASRFSMQQRACAVGSAVSKSSCKLHGCRARCHRRFHFAPRASSASSNGDTGASSSDGTPSSSSSSTSSAVSPLEHSLGDFAQTITNLFPVWVVLAGGLALVQPSLFTWFKMSYITSGLALTMLGMGLTMKVRGIKPWHSHILIISPP